MAPRLHPLHLTAVLGGVAPLLGLALVVPAPWHWLPLGAAMGATGIGTVFLLRPALLRWNLVAWVSHSSLPALLLVAMALSLRAFAPEPPWALGLGWVLALVALGLLLVGKHVLLVAKDGLVGSASEMLNLAAYLTAFLLFVALYRVHLPLAVKIGGVSSVAGLLTLELLGYTPAPLVRRLVFATVVSLGLAEVVLSLHFWPQEGAFTIAFLLVGFYLCTGLLQSYLRHRLSPWVVMEFLAVGVVSFVALYTFQAWQLG
ncbi:MAG: hypothetical protein HY689_15045 [Chloroflexi bacterium]|nr:hypothetical protein [Chloroflexota bacterium]